MYIIIIRASDGKGEISREPGTTRLKLICTFSRPRENLLIRDFAISRFSCHHNSSSPLSSGGRLGGLLFADEFVGVSESKDQL